MKKFLINQEQVPFFQRTWKKHLSYKNGKVPESPSPGWLAGVAAKNNLCSIIIKNEGKYAVCGNELWKFKSPDSFMCNRCYKVCYPNGKPHVNPVKGFGVINEVEAAF